MVHQHIKNLIEDQAWQPASIKILREGAKGFSAPKLLHVSHSNGIWRRIGERLSGIFRPQRFDLERRGIFVILAFAQLARMQDDPRVAAPKKSKLILPPVSPSRGHHHLDTTIYDEYDSWPGTYPASRPCQSRPPVVYPSRDSQGYRYDQNRYPSQPVVVSINNDNDEGQGAPIRAWERHRQRSVSPPPVTIIRRRTTFDDGYDTFDRRHSPSKQKVERYGHQDTSRQSHYPDYHRAQESTRGRSFSRPSAYARSPSPTRSAYGESARGSTYDYTPYTSAGYVDASGPPTTEEKKSIAEDLLRTYTTAYDGQSERLRDRVWTRRANGRATPQPDRSSMQPEVEILQAVEGQGEPRGSRTSS